jgi:transposase
MNYDKIITSLLGIDNVTIEDIKLYKKDLRAVVVARQDKQTCYCDRCGLQLSRVHEWICKELKAPPLGIYSEVKVKYYQLRAHCDDCDKVILAKVNWIHTKFRSMTCSFAEVAGRLMEEITCEAVGRILKCNPKTLWNLDQYRMEHMMQFLKLPDDLDLSYLCADEVHFRTIKILERKGLFAKRSQPQFITNVVCPSAGKVLFNGAGRDGKALETALSILSPGQLLSVEKFAVDMHEAFISKIKEKCLNAEICVDRFHLAQTVNKAFDKVRRSEFSLAKKNNDQFCEGMLEPHRKFVLVAREKYLSKSEMKLLAKLRDVNKNINTAMLLVECFHAALDKKSIPSFRKALKTWYIVVRESKLEPFLDLAKTIRKYRRNIEAYITSRLTTGVIEGLNNKIKVLKRMGYGYTNEISFMRKILQRCGYLNHQSINTDHLFYSAA